MTLLDGHYSVSWQVITDAGKELAEFTVSPAN
jgi:hypothetical protein